MLKSITFLVVVLGLLFIVECQSSTENNGQVQSEKRYFWIKSFANNYEKSNQEIRKQKVLSWLLNISKNFMKSKQNSGISKYGGIPKEHYMIMQQKLENKFREMGGKYLEWIPKLQIE